MWSSDKLDVISKIYLLFFVSISINRLSFCLNSDLTNQGLESLPDLTPLTELEV